MNNQGRYDRNYPSIYRGIVEENTDPDGIGRCRIRVPSVHGELTYPVDILPWARPIVTTPVSKGKGSVNLPGKGDVVWVLFEGANKDFPVYIGGSYAEDELDVSNDRVDFYIDGDNKVSYDRNSGAYSITVGGTEVVVTPGMISLLGNTNVAGGLAVGGGLNVAGGLFVGGPTILGDLRVSSFNGHDMSGFQGFYPNYPGGDEENE